MGEMSYVTTDDNQFLHGVVDLLTVAERLIEENSQTAIVVPVLLYTALDNLSFLGCSEKAAAGFMGPRFKEWTSEHLLEYLGHDCTSEELWRSRCSILHDGTAVSRPGKSEPVREIWFCSGHHNEALMRGFQQEIVATKGEPQRVAMSLERLLHSLCSAAVAWASMSSTPEALAVIEKRSSKQFRFVREDGEVVLTDVWTRLLELQERARRRRFGE